MKIILNHPTGNANVRAVAKSLAEAGILYKFYTSLAAFPGNTLDKLGSLEPLSELRRRSFDPILQPVTQMYPWWEVGRTLSIKLGLKKFHQHEQGVFCVDNVYQKSDQHVASHLKHSAKMGVKGVYAYEDGAYKTFQRAKELNLSCIYDLPVAYWKIMRKLLTEEAERLPSWAITLEGGISDSAAKLERKTKELELADIVIVPSDFVKDSLSVFEGTKKIVVSHFGSPIQSENISLKDLPVKADTGRPLRVLFVGSMGQRKGLADLFAAMKLLKGYNIELIVMGSLLAPFEFYKEDYPDFIYEPVRSHDEVLELMRSCDVFCLPSLVEGRALVMQEAMSQGLPLIVTPNTGGADLIIEGKTGFLVPTRSPHIIAEKLNWFVENKSAIPEMSNLARIHAAQYKWEAYGEKIVQAVTEYLD